MLKSYWSELVACSSFYISIQPRVPYKQIRLEGWGEACGGFLAVAVVVFLVVTFLAFGAPLWVSWQVYHQRLSFQERAVLRIQLRSLFDELVVMLQETQESSD